MLHSTDILFRALFDQLPEPRLIIKANAPDFTIVAVNKAYVAATGFTFEELSGQSLWKLFGSNTASTNVRAIFEQGLNDALQHKAEIKLPIFRFDLSATATERSKPRWWQVDITPVNDENGDVTYLLCTTRNVTIHVEDQMEILRGSQNQAAMLVRQQESDEQIHTLQGQLNNANDVTETQVAQRTQELTDSEYELNRVLAVTPVGLCVLKGDNFSIKTANKPMLALWGCKQEDVIGRPLLEVFPELQGQPFPALLQKVMGDKKMLTLSAQPVLIVHGDRKPVKIFVDFSYDPLFDTAGNVEGVLVTVNDVTEIIKAQQLLQNRQEELETMNEELNAANDELQRINNELNAINNGKE